MPDTTNDRSARRQRYAPLIEQCRDMVVVFCDAQLSELFQNVNAALLDFAERAESNAVQSRFFDAMSQLQRRRADMEHIFRDELNLGFDRLGKEPPKAKPDSDAATVEGIELALMEPEEMEESVAAENLVLRANAVFFQELYALSQRLGAIVSGTKLKDHQIPGGPHHLVMAFRHSLDGLDVEVRVKLILYALFDKFVLKNARATYNEYNALLIGAGVLPNLKPMPVRHGRSAQGKAKPETEAAQEKGASGQATEHQSLGAELFDSILDLMSSHRQGRGGRGAPARKPTPEESQEQTKELLSAISRLQATQTPEAVSSAVAAVPQYPDVEVDTAFLSRVKDALSLEREEVLSKVDRDKLSPMDADLIDLIGMLFEYMLNDPILPNVAKALLSHLHTPYLKLAIIDRRLLVDSQHPARRLLDQMVEAGSQWIDETNPSRGIFPTIQHIVDRVLQEFTDDIALFDELLKELEDKIGEQQRRSDTMEQRTQEAARGREKLALAKQRSAREIQALVHRFPLPSAVAGFLSRTWLDHLVFILLRDEEQDQGKTWKHAVGLAERLVSLFDPRASDERRRAPAAAIAQLRGELAEVVRKMGAYNNATVDALLALLDAPQSWYGRAIGGQTAEGAAAQAVALPDSFESPPTVAAQGADADLTASEKDMIERLRKMRYGTWFELKGAAGGPSRRIKLSWMSPLTSTCMFVDRSGVQAEVKALRELAQELLDGRARVVSRPKHPFIDRALVSIRRMLRGEQKAQSAPT